MIVRRRRQATTGRGIGSQSANTHPRRSRGPVWVFKTRILTLSDEKTSASLMYFSKSLDRLILAPCSNDSQSVDVDAGFVVTQAERVATTAYRTRIEASLAVIVIDDRIIPSMVDLQESEPRNMSILWFFVSNQIDVMSLNCCFLINTSELSSC